MTQIFTPHKTTWVTTSARRFGPARTSCMDMAQEFPLLTQGAAAAAFEILEVTGENTTK